MKWLTVEKRTDSVVFTVVLMGARGHNVYITNTAILFTVQNHREITVVPTWNNNKYKTKSDSKGYWEISIDTPEAGYEPYEIEFSDGEALRLENILIGEVWICSGQSNMEMPLNGFWGCPIENSTEDIATSGLLKGVRMATVERRGSQTPQSSSRGSWKVSNPENSPWFSATGFYFARMLNKVLNVPVGIINCSWGGSRVEG